jgi:SSS family solute:Na+ symporter
MTSVDWTVIFLYFLGLLAVGAVFARKAKTASGMFVAGRSSPWWLSGISAYMAMFSAGTFVVWGGISYEHGLVGAMTCSVYGIAAFIAGRFFSGTWRSTSLSTAAEFIQLRFGRGAFNFYTTYRGVMLCMSGLSLYALAVMLCPLMPLPDGSLLRDAVTGNLSIDWACIILTVIVIAYTMSGGLWAVLVTDTLQFLVLTVSVIIVVPLIVMKAGGFSQIAAGLPEGFLQPTAPGFSWFFLVGWMLINCFQLGAEWHFVQRHLCVPSPRDARKAMYLFGCMYLVTPFLWMAPPMIYRSMNPSADPQEAYILACKTVMPPGMIGMMAAAMFSATASSLAGVLNMYAGVLTDDVYRRRFRPSATDSQSVRAGRLFTVLLGIYILLGALVLPRLGSYRDIIIVVGSVVGSSLLLPTLWVLFSRRVGSGVVWCTLASGITAGVLFKFGFSGSGWFSGIDALSGISALVKTYPREMDLLVGITVPLVILTVAELTGHVRPEWQRLQDGISKAQAEDTSSGGASRLPLLVVGWSLGFLAVIVLGLTPLSGSRWITMLAAGCVLLVLCILIIAVIRRPGTKAAECAQPKSKR